MDTVFLHQALRNWQERNHSSRTWEMLSQSQRSQILGDAQILKTNLRKSPITIEDVIVGEKAGR